MADHDACCDRRELLKRGAMGLFGLGLLGRTFMREAYGITPDPATQLYDAVVAIFYSGGPSQTDTWDPKPGSTSNVFGTIGLGAQDIYGAPVRISEVFPNLASLVQSDPSIGLGLVRSMSHGNGSHEAAQKWMNCFWQSPVADAYPSTASSMAHYFQDKSRELPGAVMVRGSNGDDANDPKGGETPRAFQVFDLSSTTRMLQRPSQTNAARYDRRKTLVDAFNARFLGTRPDVAVKAWDAAVAQAHELTTSGKAAQAFDLTGKATLPGGTNSSGTHLRNLTLCQELVMAGVPYVACGRGGNDSHSNNMAAIRRNWGDDTDVPLAQMARNLKASGKRVLVVMGGEFGRTPASVSGGRDGRDHWADGFSWALLSINQPKFRTTAVGDTGPDGLYRERSGTLVDPVKPSALGALLYRALGFPVGSDPRWNVPTAIGSRPPVDATIATSTARGGGTWLMQQLGLT